MSFVHKDGCGRVIRERVLIIRDRPEFAAKNKIYLWQVFIRNVDTKSNLIKPNEYSVWLRMPGSIHKGTTSTMVYQTTLQIFLVRFSARLYLAV